MPGHREPHRSALLLSRLAVAVDPRIEPVHAGFRGRFGKALPSPDIDAPPAREGPQAQRAIRPDVLAHSILLPASAASDQRRQGGFANSVISLRLAMPQGCSI